MNAVVPRFVFWFLVFCSVFFLVSFCFVLRTGFNGRALRTGEADFTLGFSLGGEGLRRRQRDDGGQVAALVQRRAVPAARAELELALVDGATGAALDAQHERRVFLAELHLFRDERFGQLVAQRRVLRPDRRH